MDSDKKREQTRLRVERYREKQAALPTFEDLPSDVQRSIESLSDSPEGKAQRTVIALDYQKKIGKRYSSGIDCRIPVNLARPGDKDYQAHTEHEEYCDRCSRVLPRLEQPRQHKATCFTCLATAIPAKFGAKA